MVFENWKNLQEFKNFVDYWNCKVMNKLEYECLRNCAPKMIGFLNNSGLCKLTELYYLPFRMNFK